ncbi:MAG TPA: methionyl-tRNA formyltransferase [Treponemataceae bacterium]|nr:methionyl-tRNA formyltransferase [Treponemataceae bacterium]HPS43783.1 methionyl-tRNA formyltransferase [Treponemataceae bacterium]
MLRVLFAGTPECAVPSLEALARAHRVVAVLTNPPAPAGRSGVPVPSPVEAAARRLMADGAIEPDTPIITPEKLNDAVRAEIARARPDIMACFAYGKIFGPKTLALFPLGAVNVHPSLLPRWRGCAPVPAAILARDGETGVTVQKMALEMDSGDVIAQIKIPLDGTETAESLLAHAAALGAPLLVEAIGRFERGPVEGTPQDGSLATYCAMLRKEDGEIDWTRSAAEIDAKIRAYAPWPGAFTVAGGNVLLIHKAHVRAESPAQGGTGKGVPGSIVGIDKKAGILVQTGDGTLALETLQWRTKKALDFKSFLNGTRNFPDLILGQKEQKVENHEI